MTGVDQRQADEQFAQLMRERDLRMAFQPIVHLPTGAVVGYEALIRGPEGSVLASAESLLAAAVRAGRLTELDWLARSRACRAALEAELDVDLFLMLNIEPIALDSECPPDLWPDIERGFKTFRIVLEVTERSLDRDPGTLLDAIERYRPLVSGLALDDVGSHPATLSMLPLVAPAIIKIDRPVVQSEPHGYVARVLNAVLGQVERTGATVLAEGIETEEHRRHAVAYGATMGQGHRLGHAGPLPAGPLEHGQIVQLNRMQTMVVPTPFAALAGNTVGPAGDELIAELIRNVGSYADVTRPTLYVLFTDADRLHPGELDRMADLASAGTFAAVLGPGIPTEPGRGIRGTGQRHEPLPTGEWAAVTISPGLCTAVLARAVPGNRGRWEYGITQDWSRTVAAARSLVRRLGAPEPRPQAVR